MLANVFRNIGLILVLLFLTQLTEPDTVGRYALALAITTPAFAFAQFGLRGVYLTLRTRLGFSSYAIVQGVGVVGASAVSVAVAALADPSLVSTVLLVSLFKSADNFCELYSAPLQKHGMSILVFWGFLASAVLGGAAVGWGLVSTGELDVALTGLVITNLLVTVFFFALPATRLANNDAVGAQRSGAVGQVLRAGIPTGLALSVLALVLTLPQYFLAATAGTTAVGYFAVVLYIFMAADLFTGTLVQSWLPQARSRFEESDRIRGDFLLMVARVVVKWTLLYIPISVFGMIFAYLVFPIVFSGYELTIEIMLPLVITILLLPTLYFSSSAISIRNLYSHNLTTGVVAAAASLIACILLVPEYGVVGALWATFFGALGRAVSAALIVVVAERTLG